MKEFTLMICTACNGPYYVKTSYVTLTSLSTTEYLGGWCPYCGSNSIKKIIEKGGDTMPIEKGKTYRISIERDSSVGCGLQTYGINCIAELLLGKVTQVHAFGFLFKLTDCPKVAELNILWTILKWIFPEEKEENGGDTE